MWHIATGAFLVIIWVPLAHNRALPLLNLIFTKLIDNIIIYYIIMEAITSYITCSYKKKKTLYNKCIIVNFDQRFFIISLFFINQTNKIYIYIFHLMYQTPMLKIYYFSFIFSTFFILKLFHSYLIDFFY